jgi:hypothetical protein
MSEPQVVNTLVRKRDEIEAHIKSLEKQLGEARMDLVHVKATIRLFNRDTAPEGVRAYMDLSRLFGRGELARLGFEALEAAQGDLDSREITRHVLQAKGWDIEDKHLRSAVCHRVMNMLLRQVKAGRVMALPKLNGVGVWRLSGL